MKNPKVKPRNQKRNQRRNQSYPNQPRANRKELLILITKKSQQPTQMLETKSHLKKFQLRSQSMMSKPYRRSRDKDKMRLQSKALLLNIQKRSRKRKMREQNQKLKMRPRRKLKTLLRNQLLNIMILL